MPASTLHCFVTCQACFRPVVENSRAPFSVDCCSMLELSWPPVQGEDLMPSRVMAVSAWDPRVNLLIWQRASCPWSAGNPGPRSSVSGSPRSRRCCSASGHAAAGRSSRSVNWYFMPPKTCSDRVDSPVMKVSSARRRPANNSYCCVPYRPRSFGHVAHRAGAQVLLPERLAAKRHRAG